MKSAIVLLVLIQGFFAKDLPKVLPPIREDGNELAILITPGAYINGLMYEPLGKYISFCFLYTNEYQQ